MERPSDRYLVRAGDVIFRSRGERTIAAAVDSSFRETALAVSPLMILRPDTRLVSPAYLAWAINQAPVQRLFDEEAQGTNLRMVSRSTLEKVTIPIPDHEMQARILAIDALAERERQLSHQINQKHYDLTHRILVERAAQCAWQSGMERMPR
jgi:restriction endonuclease S subunit